MMHFVVAATEIGGCGCTGSKFCEFSKCPIPVPSLVNFIFCNFVYNKLGNILQILYISSNILLLYNKHVICGEELASLSDSASEKNQVQSLRFLLRKLFTICRLVLSVSKRLRRSTKRFCNSTTKGKKSSNFSIESIICISSPKLRNSLPENKFIVLFRKKHSCFNFKRINVNEILSAFS